MIFFSENTFLVGKYILICSYCVLKDADFSLESIIFEYFLNNVIFFSLLSFLRKRFISASILLQNTFFEIFNCSFINVKIKKTNDLHY